MTEADWLAGTVPGPMLAYLRPRVRGTPAGKARRWRLLAVALAREVQLPDIWAAVGQVIDHVELAAGGAARLADARPVEAGPDDYQWGVIRAGHPARLCQALCHPEAYTSAFETAGAVSHALTAGPWRVAAERCGQLVQEVFGNPFRPVAFDLAWRTPTTAAVAQGVYAGRAFDRLPVLADALEDAGCDAADLLAHLRGPGPHVRGCWALDLVLGLG